VRNGIITKLFRAAPLLMMGYLISSKASRDRRDRGAGLEALMRRATVAPCPTLSDEQQRNDPR
jgi:hypothetical protein